MVHRLQTRAPDGLEQGATVLDFFARPLPKPGSLSQVVLLDVRAARRCSSSATPAQSGLHQHHPACLLPATPILVTDLTISDYGRIGDARGAFRRHFCRVRAKKGCTSVHGLVTRKSLTPIDGAGVRIAD